MEDFVGTVRLFALSEMPRGWLRCDGSAKNQTEYMALYAMLGDRHGESGKWSFRLPSIAPVICEDGTELHYHICAWGPWPPMPYG